MSTTTGTLPGSGGAELRKAVTRRMIQVFSQIAVMGVILFAASGHLDWLWAWAYLGISAAVVVVFGLFFLQGHEDLVAERGQVKEGTKRWDRVITAIMLVVFLAMYIVAGLDNRFGWSGEIALWARIAAAGVMVLGYALLYWAMLSNQFFATTVRIQNERAHRVVESGPYRVVRHPGYVGIVANTVASLVLLGSWWAVLISAADVALYVIRTALEDRTLQAELPGYKEYATRTRYRLIPGIY